MKIAIVAPSPVPFCIGGAENLSWGLLDQINQTTSHQADLIKLPAPERNFWEIVDSYRNFSRLDLSEFEMVISTKYPSWMVSHPNHICYMLHRLRGLYDTYPDASYGSDFVNQPKIEVLRSFMAQYSGSRSALEEFFERMDQLRELDSLPANIFAFPGPFIREIVHFLDGIGLAPTAIKRFTAISNNLTKRKNYFPKNIDVEVIYPPSNLKSLHQGKSDYLFTIGRLDSAKRIDLLIKALKHVETDIPFYIAGTGPDEPYLRSLAADDGRIAFLGFVNDSEVVDLYANALLVLYAPYDEDYGMVTIEAMMSGKPVVTTNDAGGPNEFVVDGVTGFSASPEPKDLAERIDYLCKNPEEAYKMGQSAKKKVKPISWERTVNRLLNSDYQCIAPNVQIKKRKKITVATTFPVYPPRNGGQHRVFHLYRHLASESDIDVVAITPAGKPSTKREIAPGLYEIRIPMSFDHAKAESELSKQLQWLPITDMAMPKLYHLTPEYLHALTESSASADYVVASHPYLINAIEACCRSPIWYEAQDIEYELKKQFVPDSGVGRELLRLTHEVEQKCCDMSELVMVCSHDNSERLQLLYHLDSGKVVEVPNGVNIEDVSFTPLNGRKAIKQQLGLENTFTAIFLGSWHGPNLEAVREIFTIAEELPDIKFIILGSVCLALEGERRSSNVGFMGVVDEETKDFALTVADVAINPMTTGSGTNLKVLDYCASGIPVISTPYGVRGLLLKDREHLIIAPLESFLGAIRNLRQSDASELETMTNLAREMVVTHYDWKIIAQRFVRESRLRGLL